MNSDRTLPMQPSVISLFWQKTLRVIAADTRQIRGSLALVSFLMGLELMMPWNTLSRHGLEILASVFSDYSLGIVCWLHCGLMLRTEGLLSDTEMPRLDKWGYRLGFALFASLFLSIDIEIGAATLQGMSTAVLAVEAFLLMIRRGNGAKGVA